MATQTETLTIPLQVLEQTLTASTHHDAPPSKFSRLQKVAVVAQLSGVNLCASATNGLVVIGLPIIAADLGLSESLAFWPSSAQNLGTAAILLLAGSVADAFGARAVDLAGCFSMSAFMLGAAGTTTGYQLVVMRALQGAGVALHYSSAVALVTQTVPKGKGRNLAFAVLGLSQPLGFSFGLVLGGLLIDATGWRAGWFLYGGICMFLSVLGLWVLPHSPEKLSLKERLRRCETQIDWVGALLVSAFMALLCYFLAALSADSSRIRDPDTITLLCLCVVALPSFVAWMYYQERKGRPALIPNSLWKNSSFSTICAITALAFCGVNAMELFSNLYFQEIQHLSALQSSIRIVPSLVVGVLIGLICGFLVHKIRAMYLISIASLLSAIAPILMALIDPQWSYWVGAFFAQIMTPVSANIMFTVGLIVISEVFTDDTQALAGAVFNTSSQFGTALGLAILQTISSKVAGSHSMEGAEGRETDAVLQGYRASFWAIACFTTLCAVLSVLGLRKAGKVGVKQE